jgi:hypothetical protein
LSYVEGRDLDVSLLTLPFRSSEEINSWQERSKS